LIDSLIIAFRESHLQWRDLVKSREEQRSRRAGKYEEQTSQSFEHSERSRSLADVDPAAGTTPLTPDETKPLHRRRFNQKARGCQRVTLMYALARTVAACHIFRRRAAASGCRRTDLISPHSSISDSTTTVVPTDRSRTTYIHHIAAPDHKCRQTPEHPRPRWREKVLSVCSQHCRSETVFSFHLAGQIEH